MCDASASEMTYINIVSGGVLNSTHSLYVTHIAYGGPGIINDITK